MDAKLVDSQPGRATIYWITKEEVVELSKELKISFNGSIELDDDDLSRELLAAEFKLITKREGTAPKSGDLLKHTFNSYRNSFTFISNGLTFEPLYYDIDDYGSVPPTFLSPTQFPVDYWVDRIEHNNIVWIDFETFKDQMKWTPLTVDQVDLSGFEDFDTEEDFKGILSWTYKEKDYLLYFFSPTPAPTTTGVRPAYFISSDEHSYTMCYQH